jgi:hypothetical protein
MIVLLLIIACFALYRSGALAKFLKSCKLEETATETTPAPPEVITDRDRLETDASYILSKQGITTPDTVRTMSDEMLIHIIREYLDI